MCFINSDHYFEDHMDEFCPDYLEDFLNHSAVVGAVKIYPKEQ